MNEIDYEALGLVAEYNEPTGDGTTVRRAEFVEQARAVVAAFRDQGLVVVRTDYLDQLLAAYTNYQREWHLEHYGNTEDLDSWIDTPAIKHIKEVIGEEESND